MSELSPEEFQQSEYILHNYAHIKLPNHEGDLRSIAEGVKTCPTPENAPHPLRAMFAEMVQKDEVPEIWGNPDPDKAKEELAKWGMS